MSRGRSPDPQDGSEAALGICRPTRCGGFTLVEILIVVSILGILAAMVVPRFQNHASTAEIASLQTNLRLMRIMIEQYQATHGEFPDTIQSTWFAGGIPDHPQNNFGVPAVQVEAKPASSDPANKMLLANSPGAYWYNSANGSVRARVLRQTTMAKTNALYDEVNGN